jgi:hypothetical protein
MSAAIVSSIVSSRRDAIEKAYSLGVITEEEYHSKMQEYGNFSSQNGVSRKRPTPDSSGTRILVCSQWETLQTFESYEVALAYIKSDILGPIKWAKSTGKPGDRRFVCNAHEGCEKPFRICDDKKGSSLVQEYMDIDHSGLPKLKRRKNGIFTYEQEAVAKTATARLCTRIGPLYICSPSSKRPPRASSYCAVLLTSWHTHTLVPH